MELSLNLLWLLLVVASVALWRRQTSRSVGRRRFQGSRPRLLALGCALALLFPVISITDDLHAEQAILEDSNPSKRFLKTSAASHTSSNLGNLSHPALYNPLLAFASRSHQVFGRVLRAEVRLAGSVSTSPCAGRAPPCPHS